MLRIARDKFYKFLVELGLKSMSPHRGESYYYVEKRTTGKTSYSIQEEFETTIGDEDSRDNMKLYGWSIERRIRPDIWVDWNHKVYSTKDIALHAINQVREWGHDTKNLRVTPLYIFVDNGYRDYIIDKIIQINDENNNIHTDK